MFEKKSPKIPKNNPTPHQVPAYIPLIGYQQIQLSPTLNGICVITASE